jgi:tetratricopeptide (TPR) repeat protein
MRAVLEVDPGYAQAHHNLGVIAQWQQDYAASIDHFRRALAAREDSSGHDTALALSHSLMALGRYEEGWPYYEHRPGGLMREPRARGLWDGTALPHGALAVMGEQGFGDVIQFCRYLPRLRPRVGKLYLVLDGPFAPLAPLLASLEGIDAIVTDRRAGPPINAYCLVTTAAHLAGASTANPGTTPYLAAPADRVAVWGERLGPRAASPAKRVGLVWGGSPRVSVRESDIDARRSIDPALLDRLAALRGIEWHSLQLGPAARKSDRLSRAFRLRDFSDFITDFADTAAYIRNLDLLITVDTSAAHVAGAIGAPVWMLNRFDTCWRWGPAGRTTPWYPSMRIFRQPSYGDWDSVVAELDTALQRWCA